MIRQRIFVKIRCNSTKKNARELFWLSDVFFRYIEKGIVLLVYYVVFYISRCINSLSMNRIFFRRSPYGNLHFITQLHNLPPAAFSLCRGKTKPSIISPDGKLQTAYKINPAVRSRFFISFKNKVLIFCFMK